eukprot:5679942-Amphidinium_carterae.1
MHGKEKGYAIPAFNCTSTSTVNAVLEAEPLLLESHIVRDVMERSIIKKSKILLTWLNVFGTIPQPNQNCCTPNHYMPKRIYSVDFSSCRAMITIPSFLPAASNCVLKVSFLVLNIDKFSSIALHNLFRNQSISRT